MTYDENILDSDWLKPTAPTHVLANKRLRCCNFLIDYAIGGPMTALLIGSVLGLVLAFLQKQDWILIYQSSVYAGYYKLMMTAFVMINYYTFCEYVMNGKTIGKFITGTRTVSREGQPLRFQQVLLRSFARFIPLETLSVLLGNGTQTGWHDQISKTCVVKEKNRYSIPTPLVFKRLSATLASMYLRGSAQPFESLDS